MPIALYCNGSVTGGIGWSRISEGANGWPD